MNCRAQNPPDTKAKKKADEEIVGKCSPGLLNQMTLKPPAIRPRKGERFKGGPLATFEVDADGNVNGAKIKKSSGLRQIDEWYLKSIQARKYSKRLGCPAIDSEESLTVDFR